MCQALRRGCSHRGHHMGNGSVSLKLHFLSEEPPVVCLAGEARSRGRWAREGIRVCRVGLDSQMWSLGLASGCVSQCRGLTGHVTSYTPPPPQGPRSGPGVLSPMGEGSRPDRSGGWGSHCHSWCPHPQCIWLGGAVGKLALVFAWREQYVQTPGAGLRLPNSQSAWGDNI